MGEACNHANYFVGLQQNILAAADLNAVDHDTVIEHIVGPAI